MSGKPIDSDQLFAAIASLMDGKNDPAVSGGEAIEQELIAVGEPGVPCKF